MPRRSRRAAKAGTIQPPNELRLGFAPCLDGLAGGVAGAGLPSVGQPGALFVGAVVKHDIAELVDPHINIVAKVPKAALAHLKK